LASSCHNGSLFQAHNAGPERRPPRRRSGRTICGKRLRPPKKRKSQHMLEALAHRQAEYQTADLHLASFLRSRGFAIVDIRREKNRFVFVFQDSTETRRAILEYANDGPVGVRSFCNTLRDLKSLTRDTGERNDASTGID
jgi:uncharacterized protein DUF5659